MYRIIYNLYSKQIMHVLFITGDTVVGPDYSIIQGDLWSCLNQCAVLGINTQPFVDFLTENNIDVTGMEEKISVSEDRAKGGEMINRFLEENKRIEITTADLLAQSSALADFRTMLQAGELTAALDLLNNVIPDEAFILVPPYESSGQRKASYITEINDYFNPPLPADFINNFPEDQPEPPIEDAQIIN